MPETYGLPWLEDLDTRVWSIPGDRVKEFQETVREVVTPRLQAADYVLMGVEDTQIYYGHKVFDELTAFVKFSFGHSPQTGGCNLYVRLHRTKGDSPNYIANGKGEILQAFADLLSRGYGFKFNTNEYGVEELLWRYTTREELANHLRDIADKLIAYGIPWLESPTSIFHYGYPLNWD